MTDQVTATETAFAAEYLGQTRDGVREAVAGLRGGQWEYKLAPDRWSIAEILEHLAILEVRIQGIVGKMADAAEDSAGADHAERERVILAAIPERGTKLMAPPHVQPKQQWSGPEGLQKFVEARGRTIELVSAPVGLRGRVFPHPFFGPWDSYQWILGAASHSARHTKQIVEVRSDPGFPRDAVR